MRGCGFAHPPKDGSPDAEMLDRFKDFLHAVGGPPVTQAEIDAGRTTLRTPSARYRIRYLAWKMSQPADPWPPAAPR
jgi:hypothetical protein